MGAANKDRFFWCPFGVDMSAYLHNRTRTSDGRERKEVRHLRRYIVIVRPLWRVDPTFILYRTLSPGLLYLPRDTLYSLALLSLAKAQLKPKRSLLVIRSVQSATIHNIKSSISQDLRRKFGFHCSPAYIITPLVLFTPYRSLYKCIIEPPRSYRWYTCTDYRMTNNNDSIPSAGVFCLTANVFHHSSVYTSPRFTPPKKRRVFN